MLLIHRALRNYSQASEGTIYARYLHATIQNRMQAKSTDRTTNCIILPQTPSTKTRKLSKNHLNHPHPPSHISSVETWPPNPPVVRPASKNLPPLTSRTPKVRDIVNKPDPVTGWHATGYGLFDGVPAGGVVRFHFDAHVGVGYWYRSSIRRDFGRVGGVWSGYFRVGASSLGREWEMIGVDWGEEDKAWVFWCAVFGSGRRRWRWRWRWWDIYTSWARGQGARGVIWEGVGVVIWEGGWLRFRWRGLGFRLRGMKARSCKARVVHRVGHDRGCSGWYGSGCSDCIGLWWLFLIAVSFEALEWLVYWNELGGEEAVHLFYIFFIELMSHSESRGCVIFLRFLLSGEAAKWNSISGVNRVFVELPTHALLSA